MPWVDLKKKRIYYDPMLVIIERMKVLYYSTTSNYLFGNMKSASKVIHELKSQKQHEHLKVEFSNLI